MKFGLFSKPLKKFLFSILSNPHIPHSYPGTTSIKSINFEQPFYKQLYWNFQYFQGTLGHASGEIVWTC